MAFGVLAAARELGIEVPGRPVGHRRRRARAGGTVRADDDRPVPARTGRARGQTILAELGVDEAAAASASLPFELVVRGSTAPPH
jgi:DNA-binding LacI/PurR family transcriptional regulator